MKMLYNVTRLIKDARSASCGCDIRLRRKMEKKGKRGGREKLEKMGKSRSTAGFVSDETCAPYLTV